MDGMWFVRLGLRQIWPPSHEPKMETNSRDYDDDNSDDDDGVGVIDDWVESHTF